jgi:hypothetical protein
MMLVKAVRFASRLSSAFSACSALEEVRLPEEHEQGVTEEDSPELGQTEQVVSGGCRATIFSGII